MRTHARAMSASIAMHACHVRCYDRPTAELRVGYGIPDSDTMRTTVEHAEGSHSCTMIGLA